MANDDLTSLSFFALRRNRNPLNLLMVLLFDGRSDKVWETAVGTVTPLAIFIIALSLSSSGTMSCGTSAFKIFKL